MDSRELIDRPFISVRHVWFLLALLVGVLSFWFNAWANASEKFVNKEELYPRLDRIEARSDENYKLLLEVYKNQSGKS